MRLTKLTLCNFRCFGAEELPPTIIDLSDFAAFIGANGAGKTAILQGLVRLFGERPADRRITKADFHVPPSTVLGQGSLTRQLWIEARLEFPDLATGQRTHSIPECFNQMLTNGPGQAPFCRVRLEATWTQTAQQEGEIDEKLWWVTQADASSIGAQVLPDEAKLAMSNSERSRIQVLYVPAIRDPAAQLRQAAGALLRPLLNAIDWNPTTVERASSAAQEVQDAIRQEPGMQQLESAIVHEWRQLQDFPPLQEVLLQSINTDFDSLLRYMGAVFRTCEGAHLQPVESLSDGLRSLFYFALLGARFELEKQTVERALRQVGLGQQVSAFNLDAAQLPSLTIFAIEEPENHLSPHYLTHIISLLRRLRAYDRIQVLLTSQSPAILSRIDPEEIRHVQHEYHSCKVHVRPLVLPPAQDEAFKYIKEAVKAYPELYFAKAVVLGEGDSEAIVLPRIARELGLPLEEQLISFVPLGGRHVHHFWRLLNDLKIQHVTLLDLDWERAGGSWARIKYVIDELCICRANLDPEVFGLTAASLQVLHQKPYTEKEGLEEQLTRLESYGVYFSSPLDLDFLLLQAFPEAYEQPALNGTGPQSPDAIIRIQQATRATLKSKGGDGSTYSEAEQKAFVWYHYLFLGRGKPVTHMYGMSRLEAQGAFGTRVPEVLRRLLTRVTHTATP